MSDFATQPPQMTILSDHPIEYLGDDDPDALSLHPKLASVFDVLRHQNTRAPMAVAIYGDWGTGKSSAMRWLEQQLHVWNKTLEAGRKKQRKSIAAPHAVVQTIWFDPWKYHTREDVWRGLIAEVILHCLSADNLTGENAGQRLAQAARQFGRFLGRSFLHALSNVKVKATTGKLGPGGGIEVSGEAFRQIFDEYDKTNHPEKAYLNEFEQTLRQWVIDFFPPHPTDGRPLQRLAIFIDDLDRCLPEVALEVLEALKLYLNIPSLMFVVGLDRDVVDAVLRTHYGKHELGASKSDQYLDKMFQIEVEIVPTERQAANYVDRQIQKLDVVTGRYWSHMLDQYAPVVCGGVRQLSQGNPRETKRLLNSALRRGHAAAVDGTLGEMAEELQQERFAQGVQVFLVQRILRRRFRGSAGVMLRNDVLQWLEDWSRLIRDTEKAILDEWRRRCVRELSGREPDGRRPVADELGPKDESSPLAVEIEEFTRRTLTYVTTDGQTATLNLLTIPELWPLLEIPFSMSVGAAVATLPEPVAPRSVGKKPAAKPNTDVTPFFFWPVDLLNAVARSLKVDVDELTEDQLGKVTSLNLNGTAVSDVSPLARLTALEWLSLNGTKVSDVSPLAGLTALQTLYLGGKAVTDVSPLAKLTALRWLALRGTNVLDTSSLNHLTGLNFDR